MWEVADGKAPHPLARKPCIALQSEESATAGRILPCHACLSDIRQDLGRVQLALAQLAAGQALHHTAPEQGVQRALKAPRKAAATTEEHRRQHRPGVIAKLAKDPELRAFVKDRLATMTFKQIAAAVAETFPRDRHLSYISIWRWWHSRIKPGQAH